MVMASIQISRRRLLREAATLGSVALGATLLAACGGATAAAPGVGTSSAGSSTAGSTTVRSQAATAAAGTTAKASGSASVPSDVFAGSKASVTLEYWDWASGWEALLKQLAQAYVTAQPTYRINLQIPGDYYNKLQASFAGGSGPDAYRSNSPNAYGLANHGVLLDLSGAIAQDKQASADFTGMAKPSQQAATYANKKIAMPFGETLTLTIYNEDLVKAAGLISPAELGLKWDWNIAAEYGQKLTKVSGGAPSIWGFWANQSWEEGWLNYVLANGGQFLDPAKGYRDCVIASQQAIDALQWMVDRVLKDKVSSGDQDLKKASGLKLFQSGQMAAATMGSWQIPQIRATIVNFNLSYVPVAPATGHSSSTSNFSMVGVNPGSRVKDDAIKLALWHGSAAAQQIIGRAEFMPASLAAVESVYLDPKLGPSNRAVLGKVLAISQPEPSPDIVTFTQAMAPLGPEISAMFQGKETVADGLRKAQQQISALLQQAGRS